MRVSALEGRAALHTCTGGERSRTPRAAGWGPLMGLGITSGLKGGGDGVPHLSLNCAKQEALTADGTWKNAGRSKCNESPGQEEALRSCWAEYLKEMC